MVRTVRADETARDANICPTLLYIYLVLAILSAAATITVTRRFATVAAT